MVIKTIITLLSIFFIAFILIFQSSCGDDDIPVPLNTENTDKEGKVAVWRSDKNGLLKIAKEPELLPYEIATDFDVSISIEEGTEYQVMEGFGAALTGSSAYLIQTHLEEDEQNQLIQDLFDAEDGIGISFIRLTIGASDFSISDLLNPKSAKLGISPTSTSVPSVGSATGAASGLRIWIYFSTSFLNCVKVSGV